MVVEQPPATFPQSSRWFQRAQQVIPGGVNSPVRALQAVAAEPVFMAKGDGPYLWDEDGNRYIDYVMSWGALILGHRAPAVMAALTETLADGTGFGTATRWEVELAQLVVEALPWVEQVRLVSSGTEATMSALRLARAHTGRDAIVKFAGCYHGHADSLLAAAGSGVLTHGIPGTPGVPAAAARDTYVLPYNDLAAVERLFQEQGDSLAAVIVEPVAGNMGLVPPQPGFLAGLREITRRHGALLIFDEVITGFRVGWSGAQGLYGIEPDLTCLGKVLGGGLPVGAYGGPAAIMGKIAPAGPVYQAGTLAGNPLAVRAGLAALTQLKAPGFYDRLAAAAARLADGLRSALAPAGVPYQVQQLGSMLTVFFTQEPVTNLADAQQADTEAYGVFFRAMLAQGVYLPPSQFEAMFVSAAHDDTVIQATIDAAAGATHDLRRWHENRG